MTPTPASLRAVADWNAEKGCALYRQSAHEKNNALLDEMLKQFARHMHNADVLRRAAWMLERTRHNRRAA